MPESNLGGAAFRIRADPAQFKKGMQEMESAGRTAVARTKKHLDEVPKATRGASMGLLALSQAVDDAQYGFRAIVNNIPQMVYMFGGGAGLAGGIGIAAVAVNTLINHWDQLMNAMKSRWLNVPYDQLEKMRLAAEKAGESFDKLMEAPSDFDARRIAKIREAIIEAPNGGPAMIAKSIRQAVEVHPALKPEETAADATERKRLEHEKSIRVEGVDIIADQDIKKRLKTLNDKLEEQKNAIVKAILGDAVRAGEAGAAARGKLEMLLKDLPDFFPEGFRKDMGRIKDEDIQREIDKDRRDRERARSHEIAAQMMGGPLGTEVMLGGGGAAGPATAAQIQKMMGKGQRRIEHNVPDAVKRLMDAGLTEEQARQVIQGLNPNATFKRGKELMEKGGGHLGKLGEVPAGFIWEAHQQLLKEGIEKAQKGGPGGLEGKVGNAMGAAGALGAPKDVLAEMRAIMKDRIKAIMLERGVNEKEAKNIILREQMMRAFPEANQPAQFFNPMQFARQIQMAALSGQADVPKRSLEELVMIRRALQNMGGNRPAQVGGGVR
jgi:hypothetical protein